MAENNMNMNKPGKKFKVQYIWIALIVIVAAAAVIKAAVNLEGIISKKPKPKPKEEVSAVGETIPVKVYKVKRMDFKDTLPVLGTIKGYVEIPLKFQTSGLLESFNFEEGESVQEGDIIANLEQKEALLKLKYAEIELSNAQKLFEVGGIAEDAVEKARLEYESAKNDLEKTNIYAIADGILGSQDVDVGTYLTPNDKVGVFADINKVYADFEVIEKDAPRIKLGQKCEISVDAIPQKDYTGTVDIISPLIEGRTRTQQVKVELRNSGNELKPGMFTRGLIAVYEKKNTIVIPASAWKKTDKGYVVYVVNKDEPMASVKKPEEPKDKNAKRSLIGKPAKNEELSPSEKAKETGVVETRVVTYGYTSQDRIEITKGLEEGDLIVMELYQELQDKEKVEIAEVQEILY